MVRRKGMWAPKDQKIRGAMEKWAQRNSMVISVAPIRCLFPSLIYPLQVSLRSSTILKRNSFHRSVQAGLMNLYLCKKEVTFFPHDFNLSGKNNPPARIRMDRRIGKETPKNSLLRGQWGIIWGQKLSTSKVVQESNIRVMVERMEVMAIPLPTGIPFFVIIMIWAGPPPLSKGVTAQTNKFTQTN